MYSERGGPPRGSLLLRWKSRVPLVDPHAGASASRRLTPESAVIPRGVVMGHQRELGGEHPPVALEGQVTAEHVLNRDVLPLSDLADMLVQPFPQRPSALGRSARCLSDVDQIVLEVEGIDPALRWRNATSEWQQRACFQALDKLRPDASIKVELEPVRIVGHCASIVRTVVLETLP